MSGMLRFLVHEFREQAPDAARVVPIYSSGSVLCSCRPVGDEGEGIVMVVDALPTKRALEGRVVDESEARLFLTEEQPYTALGARGMIKSLVSWCRSAGRLDANPNEVHCPRIITAKFSSTCPLCRRGIGEGERVFWLKGDKAKHPFCVGVRECPDCRGSGCHGCRYSGYRHWTDYGVKGP